MSVLRRIQRVSRRWPNWSHPCKNSQSIQRAWLMQVNMRHHWLVTSERTTIDATHPDKLLKSWLVQYYINLTIGTEIWYLLVDKETAIQAEQGGSATRSLSDRIPKSARCLIPKTVQVLHLFLSVGRLWHLNSVQELITSCIIKHSFTTHWLTATVTKLPT